MTFEKVRVVLAPVIFLLALAFSRNAAAAPEQVLKLPFTDSSVAVQQGWKKDFGVTDVHEAIDYRKGKETFTWETFEVVAASDGELECFPDGKWSQYGNTCRIKHVIGSHVFYTLYAHLASYAKTSGYVEQGEFLGMAGDTGHPDYDIHLHFEIQDNSPCFKPCRVDPYGLEAMAGSYPQPGDGPSNVLDGKDHWWADEPPSVPGDPQETCGNGSCAGNETCASCPEDCEPCDNPDCMDTERRRCWVECGQMYPVECVQAGLSPLLMGIETCSNEVWGICDVQGMTCNQLDDEYFAPQGVIVASFECVDGLEKMGQYSTTQALGVNCNSHFYSNWPVSDCPGDLCLGVGDGCAGMQGQQQVCEVYCDVPGGNTQSGMQTCNAYCGNDPMWGPCLTNDACSP